MSDTPDHLEGAFIDDPQTRANRLFERQEAAIDKPQEKYVPAKGAIDWPKVTKDGQVLEDIELLYKSDDVMYPVKPKFITKGDIAVEEETGYLKILSWEELFVRTDPKKEDPEAAWEAGVEAQIKQVVDTMGPFPDHRHYEAILKLLTAIVKSEVNKARDCDLLHPDCVDPLKTRSPIQTELDPEVMRIAQRVADATSECKMTAEQLDNWADRLVEDVAKHPVSDQLISESATMDWVQDAKAAQTDHACGPGCDTGCDKEEAEDSKDWPRGWPKPDDLHGVAGTGVINTEAADCCSKCNCCLDNELRDLPEDRDFVTCPDCGTEQSRKELVVDQDNKENCTNQGTKLLECWLPTDNGKLVAGHVCHSATQCCTEFPNWQPRLFREVREL